MKMLWPILLTSLPLLAQDNEMRRIARESCEKKSNALNCYSYGKLLMEEQQEQEAKKYFAKSCALGNKQACEKDSLPPQQELDDIKTSAKSVQIKRPPKNMREALQRCESFSRKFPHPMMNVFIVEESVLGELNGLCKYSYTLPFNGIIKCEFTAEQRERALSNVDHFLKQSHNDASICQIGEAK
jgi:TPR repeat protein